MFVLMMLLDTCNTFFYNNFIINFILQTISTFPIYMRIEYCIWKELD